MANIPATINNINGIKYLDIKESEKEWVQDSHTEAEYQGVCQGLDMLVRHFEELEKAHYV